MKPDRARALVGRKYYDTRNATLLSGDDWNDGVTISRGGRNTFLYRTRNGAFFLVRQSWHRDELPVAIEPVDLDSAIGVFEEHMARDENRVSFEEAFPGVEIEEA